MHQKVQEHAPYDEIFGSSKKELYKAHFTPAVLASIVSDFDTWLQAWPYRKIIDLYPPQDQISAHQWSYSFWEITRLIYSHVAISAPDCLHVAAAMVLGADMFVTSDNDLQKAMNYLNQLTSFHKEVANVLNVLPEEVKLRHDALKPQKALGVLKGLPPIPP